MTGATIHQLRHIVLYVDDEQSGSIERHIQRVTIAVGGGDQLGEIDAKPAFRRPQLIVVTILNRMIDGPLQFEAEVAVGLHHQLKYRIASYSSGRERGTEQIATAIALFGHHVFQGLTAGGKALRP